MEQRSELAAEFEASVANWLSLTKREIWTILTTYAPLLSAQPCSMQLAELFNSYSRLHQMMRSMSSSTLPARSLTVEMRPSSPSTTTQTLMLSSGPKPSETV